jgi:hypothetical protein
MNRNGKPNADISNNIFTQAREENIEAGTMTRGKVDVPTTPISASGLWSARSVPDVRDNSKQVVWPSSKKALFRLVRQICRAMRLTCTEFYGAFRRTKWSFQRQSFWGGSQCQDCYLFRPMNPRKLSLSGSGMLRNIEDIRLVMSLHPWATRAEAHLIQIAWYLGAEWGLNSSDNLDGKKTYKVF